MKVLRPFLGLLLIAVLAAVPSKASSQEAATATEPKTPEEIEREIQQKEQSQRILGVVPMFGVTDRRDAPPLSNHAKFYLMAKGFTDPFSIGTEFLQAGVGQANNSFPGYGQGAGGYAKRLGAGLTDSFTSSFFSGYFYPMLLKQDPRYFRLGHGSMAKRVWYSVEQEFVARKDSGGKSFHFSNVLGAFTSGTISNAYYPGEDRGFGLTASRAGLSLAYGALGNIGIEFWPDIDRKLFHKKRPQAQLDSPPVFYSLKPR